MNKLRPQPIGDFIRAERLKHLGEGSLTRAAHTAHISPAYLSEIERGMKTAGRDLLIRIADAIRVDPSSLLRVAQEYEIARVRDRFRTEAS